MSKKMDFKKMAHTVHGNKYDYSLVEYKNNLHKVKIICSTHGIFEQSPNSHISKKCGCPKCVGKGVTTEDFIERVKIIHKNFYDYRKTKYIGVDNKITVICPNHGEFEQTAYTHLTGSGCPKCRSEKLSAAYKYSTLDFIDKAKNIHGDKYDYSLVNYINSKTKIDIICPVHGKFSQVGGSHLQGKGCPICNESKDEKQIREYLENNNLKYIPQKKFKDCRNKRPLPFDFYLPDYNVCIEYDGRQHFTYKGGFFGNKTPMEEFLKLKNNEIIKNKYCKDNDIRLIRIPFFQNNINDILKCI